MLLERFLAGGNEKALALLQKISPVAWKHIHFLGHYTFRDNTNMIDLEAMLANVTLGITRQIKRPSKILGVPAYNPIPKNLNDSLDRRLCENIP